MLLLDIFKNMSLTESFVMMLLEGRMDFLYKTYAEKLTDRFDNDNRVPAQYKSQLSDGGDVAKNLLTHFAAKDPTNKKLYVQWMVRMYLKGEMLEDIDKLPEALNVFDKAKRQLDVKDINQYKTISDVLVAVRPFKDVQGKSLGKIKSDEIEPVITTGNFKVFIPKTYKASCEYGAEDWCTAGTSKNDSYFKQYTADGPLYIIYAGGGENPKKFQMHYESNQFMNEDDKPVTQADIDFLSSFPKYKDFLNMMIKKHYSKYFK